MSEVLCLALQAYFVLLLIYVVLSWVPRPAEPFQPLVRLVRAAVDPVVAPIRRVLPPLRIGGVGLDLSILVVFFALSLLQSVVC